MHLSTHMPRMQDARIARAIERRHMHGRVRVLIKAAQVSGVLVTAIFTVSLGFTTTFWFAMASRAIIGLLNANFAIGKAAISGTSILQRSFSLAASFCPPQVCASYLQISSQRRDYSQILVVCKSCTYT
jgi:hypothetical protein